MLIALLVLLPVAFLWPVVVRFFRRLAKAEADNSDTLRLGLYQRCMSVLLAYTMLISPIGIQSLAQADTAYSQISTLTWGQDNTTIEYAYDANGSMTSKITTETSTPLEEVTYVYNLQNRLERATTDYKDGVTFDIVEYTYNDSGIRVKSHSWTEISSIPQDHETTFFLIDPANHTGYAQVLEEKDASLAVTKSYTIGDDVISQTVGASTQYLLYDGHGSTRQLLNSDGTAIDDSYSYDAYGVMLGTNDTAAENADTSLLYAGEQYDSELDHYYLRARYYNPWSGTFNRMDDFAGNNQDPQSLHKYTYAHANPINGIDPSGKMSLTLFIAIALFSTLFVCGLISTFSDKIRYGYRNPSSTERYIVENSAIPNAKRYVNNALRRLSYGITRYSYELYNTWFGAYTLSRFQKVKETFIKIQNYLNSGFAWRTFADDEKSGMYLRAKDLVLFSNPIFYIDSPDTSEFLPENDQSKPGIVIHELAHKAGVGLDVKDEEYVGERYGMSECTAIARTNPERAVNNADNYAYYAGGNRW